MITRAIAINGEIAPLEPAPDVAESDDPRVAAAFEEGRRQALEEMAVPYSSPTFWTNGSTMQPEAHLQPGTFIGNGTITNGYGLNLVVPSVTILSSSKIFLNAASTGGGF